MREELTSFLSQSTRLTVGFRVAIPCVT